MYCQIINNKTSHAFLSLILCSSGGLVFFCLRLSLGSSRVKILALAPYLVSSKHHANLRLNVSLAVRRKGSNKLVIQLGEGPMRAHFQTHGWQAALQDSPSAASCKAHTGWKEAGAGEVLWHVVLKLSTYKASLRYLTSLKSNAVTVLALIHFGIIFFF